MSVVKIGFVLLSNSQNPLPSTRITVLNMLPHLRAAGFDAHIVHEPPQPTETPDVSGMARRLVIEGFEAVFFQKVHGSSIEASARELSAAGIRTLYGVCDLVNPAMVEATDATIAVTDFLKSLYPSSLQTKIRVVHDGIENPFAQKQTWADHAGSARKRLGGVLVTSGALTHLPVLGTPPDWLSVAIVGPTPAVPLGRLREARWRLHDMPAKERLHYAGFLLNRRIRRVPWDPVGVYDQLEQADIGIIPIDGDASASSGGTEVPSWKLKSENRLTMKMAVGLPVIATPIPAYEAVLQHGSNGFFARSRADWQRCLQDLRDPQLRSEVGANARNSVLHRYSMERQASDLVNVIRGLPSGACARGSAPDPMDRAASP